MATMPLPQPDDGPAPALRILTDGQYLLRSGGWSCARSRTAWPSCGADTRVDVVYGTDGALRSTYEDAGITLHGPHRFSFGPRTAVRDLLRMSARHAGHGTGLTTSCGSTGSSTSYGARFVSRTAGASLICHLHGLPAHNRWHR
jgi:hypothetical protein